MKWAEEKGRVYVDTSESYRGIYIAYVYVDDTHYFALGNEELQLWLYDDRNDADYMFSYPTLAWYGVRYLEEDATEEERDIFKKLLNALQEYDDTTLGWYESCRKNEEE